MFKALWNQFSFPLRQRLPRLRPREFVEGPAQEAQALLPQSVVNGLNRETLKFSQFYSYLIELSPLEESSAEAYVIDLGCKNFFYAASLYYSLKESLGALQLMGLEADAGRMYIDFFRRRDYADYYTRLINRAEGEQRVYFESGDWLTWPERNYDLITCFFPFLFSDLSDNWGLPRRCFKPRAFYEKCAEEGKQVLFAHQGKEERDESRRILSEIGGRIHFEKEVSENPCWERKLPTWIILWSL